MASPVESDEARLLRLADQCVKCGYCLPVCPTFRLHRSEAESPRGRIALIQGWLSGELAPSAGLARHLGQCLECRACESVCPSLVQFGDLMDGARALRQARRPWWRRWPQRLWLKAFSEPDWWRPVVPIVRLSHHFGVSSRLAAAVRRRWPALTIALRLTAFLERPRKARGDHPPGPPETSANREASIALFLGCVARSTQGATIDAARRLLQKLAIPYDEPTDQGCCGALHRHHGFDAEADVRLRVNAQSFAGKRLLGFSSACVLELRQHGQLDAFEICQFLVEQPEFLRARPRPLRARVLVHEPCSQQLLPGAAAPIYRLLSAIPELAVQPLPGNDRCCGAAGSYVLEHPRIALELLEPKLAALRGERPDFLVTTNSGCALHLAAGLQAAGLAIPVLHPVELLERQISSIQHPS